MIWQIAARNLLRNARRSLMTLLAIGISGTAVLLFGGFVTSIWYGVQTSMVQDQGHIQVFKRGYLAYGAADPDAYTIDDVEAIMKTVRADPDVYRQIAVITPQIAFGGIAGNHQDDNSKTFVGKGLVPSDYNKMRNWDSWGLGIAQPAVPMHDSDPEAALVGGGMARMIGLCDELNLTCEDPPAVAQEGAVDQDFSGLLASASLTASTDRPAPARLDLLAAAGGGAPNIVSVDVVAAMPQAIRALDDTLVMLHYDQARQLLYDGSDKATAILVQAKNPEGADALKADLSDLFTAQDLDLEVMAFNETDPTFDRIVGMFSVIFGVVATVLGIVIVFTISNTVTMNVMERINEVGTVRALGFRRMTVFRQFLTESLLLGLIGAAFAIGGSLLSAVLINGAGLSWTPPSNATPIAIDLMVAENPALMTLTALALTLVTVAASILPATRAVRIPIVKALHHA